MRIRTGNRRKARAGRYEVVECSRHGVALRGNGWAYAAGLKFAVFECPKATCRTMKLLDCNEEDN